MSPTNRHTTPIHTPDRRQISIIIPAAGYGSRMKSYGPKSLIPIKDTTIIENQLKYIFKYFYKPQVILVTGFNSDQVEEQLFNRRVDIIHNSDWESNNVGASIQLGLKEINHKNVLIIYGDLVFNAWTLKAPFGVDSMILVDKYGLMKKEEVGCSIYKDQITNLMYDLPDKWAQIAYLTGRELEIMKRFSDGAFQFSFGFEIINHIMSKGGSFKAYSPSRMRITDIDSSKDLNKVQEVFK